MKKIHAVTRALARTAGVRRIALVVFALSVSIPFWAAQLSNARIESDPTATVQMAANLIRHDVISLDAAAPLRPSMYREPLPVFTTALAMMISDALHGPAADVREYFAGERARHLKMQNVGWILLLCLASGWAAYLLSGSFATAFAAALLAHLPFYGDWVSGTLDSLYTEQAAAALLMAGSAALIAAMQKRRLAFLVLAGAAFGALALTKAVFLYVFAGLVFVLLLTQLFARVRREAGIGFAGVALLTLSFTAALTPWLARNWREFGSVQITERGGAILFMRATKNEMTPVEYKGAFYVWAPKPLRPLVGAVLGFGPEDLMRGGPLQRLNRHPYSDFHADDLRAQRSARPDQAISFYRKVNAERNKAKRQFAAAGHPHPASAADDLLQQRAIESLLEHPAQHLAATAPFLWRGAFLPFPLLACALVYALWRRRYDLALFALPAFGMVMFYALLSHFILRYGVPTWPVALVAGSVLSAVAVRTLRRRAAREPAAALRGALANAAR